jgi:regulator of RNase E activity RraA
MAELTVPDDLMALLKTVDTPTVCNAIEVAQGTRGFDAYTKGTMLASDPSARAIVGFARTAKIAGRVTPTEPPTEIRTRRMNYFRHMASGIGPTLAVVEDLDFPNAVSAWWGEVHTAVHKGLGLQGALTNGVMRDLGDMEPGFPVIAGSIGPSHAFVHVRELATPVTVFGLTINDGDLVHADRHGALVIPPDVITTLKSAIEKLLSTEHLVLGPARSEGFNIEKLEVAWAKFENSRT